MLDAINFEKQGIPAVAVVTEPFIPTARAMAALNGLPGYPFVVVPHPIGSLDAAAVRERADAALARIEALLLSDHENQTIGHENQTIGHENQTIGGVWGEP